MKLNILLLLTAILLVVNAGCENRSSHETITNKTVQGNVEFRITGLHTGKEATPIENASITLIQSDGIVIKSGLTNAEGKANFSLNLEPDPRFLSVNISTVTAIVLAEGYNEKIIFEVPVSQDAVQPVFLQPFDPNTRNEPNFELGNLHRLEVKELLDYYAKNIGLTKQSNDAEAPWAPIKKE